MQSTGHSSTQARSSRSTHGSAITYVTLLLHARLRRARVAAGRDEQVSPVSLAQMYSDDPGPAVTLPSASPPALTPRGVSPAMLPPTGSPQSTPRGAAAAGPRGPSSPTPRHWPLTTVSETLG